MKYISSKNKLKTIFDRTIDNEIEISKNKKSYSELQSPSEGFKVPKILYDSGWVIATESGGG